MAADMSHLEMSVPGGDQFDLDDAFADVMDESKAVGGDEEATVVSEAVVNDFIEDSALIGAVTSHDTAQVLEEEQALGPPDEGVPIPALEEMMGDASNLLEEAWGDEATGLDALMEGEAGLLDWEGLPEVVGDDVSEAGVASPTSDPLSLQGAQGTIETSDLLDTEADRRDVGSIGVDAGTMKEAEVSPEEDFEATARMTDMLNVFWGACEGSETDLTALAQHKQAQKLREALRIARWQKNEVGGVLDWDVPGSLVTKTGLRDRIGALTLGDWPMVRPSVKVSLEEVKEGLRDRAMVERSMNILRFLISDVNSATDVTQRVLDVRKLLDPSAALLRVMTADFNMLSPKDFRGSTSLGDYRVFDIEVALAAKALARREWKVVKDAHHEGDDWQQRRLRRKETIIPPSYLMHTQIMGGAMVRQALEEKVRTYALWRAWLEVCVKSSNELADSASPTPNPEAIMTGEKSTDQTSSTRWRLFQTQQPADVARWLASNPRLSDPLEYNVQLGSTTADAASEVALSYLDVSFDAAYVDGDPYRPLRKTGGHRGIGNAPLIDVHAPIAWAFYTVTPRPTLSQLARLHKPDFRTGLFTAHYYCVYKTQFSGQNLMTSGAAGIAYAQRRQAGRSVQTNIVSGVGLNTNRRLDNLNAKVTAEPEKPKKEVLEASQPLFGPWKVCAPANSSILDTYRAKVPLQDDQDGANSQDAQDHPSDLFVSPRTLSLAEWCPMALFEHANSPPVLVSNLGMMSRVTRYYRPARDTHKAAAQDTAEKKLRGRLGLFGRLQLLGDSVLTLFGVPFRVKPNCGVAFYNSSLLKGPCFAHPFDPQRPLPTPEAYREQLEKADRALSSRAGWNSLFHMEDFRLTDFLLIRTTQDVTSGSPQVRLTLRPLFHGFGVNGPQVNASTYGLPNDEEVEMIDNTARVGMYSLGQCELLAEVPAPDGKKVTEIKKEWLKAYSQRLAAQGIVEFNANKQKCVSKFGGIFDQTVINRILLSIKKSAGGAGTLSSSGLASNSLASSGISIRAVSEPQIRRLVTPEHLCGLEACVLGNAALNWSGLRYVKNFDRFSVARSMLSTRDAQGMLLWAKARGQWRAFQSQVGGSTSLPKLLQLPPPFRANLPHFVASPAVISCIIEELLALTPWTSTLR